MRGSRMEEDNEFVTVNVGFAKFTEIFSPVEILCWKPMFCFKLRFSAD